MKRTYREGVVIKKDDATDNEQDENSCGVNYENFQPSFAIKKQLDDLESLEEDETNGQGEETEDDQMQQDMETHVNSSNITVTQAELIHAASQEQQHQQSNQQQSQQQQSQQMQQQQEHIDPLILPYEMQQHHTVHQQHPQQSQQIISISRPVTITRYSTQQHEPHQSTVDSTAVINSVSSNNTVDCSISASTVNQSAPANGSASRLNYFLMDVQQQMEKLNDIAQMELKVDMQKLLLDKLRHLDNYKLNRCD